jgi:cytochrome P450
LHLKFNRCKIADKIRESAARHDSDDNFVKSYIEKSGEDYDERELVFILRDLILAGTETTSCQLSWAMVLLGNRPDIQERLRAEIDSVVPRERLPSIDDKSKLPYLEATILEMMRLKTIAPLSCPRKTLTDTEVSGYVIPADSMVSW